MSGLSCRAGPVPGGNNCEKNPADMCLYLKSVVIIKIHVLSGHYAFCVLSIYVEMVEQVTLVL